MKIKRNLDGIIIREKIKRSNFSSKPSSNKLLEDNYYSQENFYPLNLSEKNKKPLWLKLIFLLPSLLFLLGVVFYFNKGYALNKFNKSDYQEEKIVLNQKENKNKGDNKNKTKLNYSQTQTEKVNKEVDNNLKDNNEGEQLEKKRKIIKIIKMIILIIKH